MRRIAALTITLAALASPAAALAAGSAAVQGATLTYTGGDLEVDTVAVTPGQGVGKVVLADPGITPGPGCSTTAPDALTCLNVNTLSVSTLGSNDSITVNALLPSVLDGGTGDDTVAASQFNDIVRGGEGADTLDGRFGFDSLEGGGGNDRIEARDGLRDAVDCGPGDDRATVDTFDVVTGCETKALSVVDPPVIEPPVVVDPPLTEQPLDKPKVDVPAPGDDRAPVTAKPLVPLPLSLDEVAPVVPDPVAKVGADGSATLELSCAATEVDGCRGVAYLDPAPAAARGVKTKAAKSKAKPRATMARRGRFGKGPFVIAAGKRGKASVKLSPSARRALGIKSTGRARAARRGRRVRAKVTVVQKGRKAAHSIVELRG